MAEITKQPENLNLAGATRDGVLLRVKGENVNETPKIYWIPIQRLNDEFRWMVGAVAGDSFPAVHQELNDPDLKLRGVLNAIVIEQDGKWASGK